MKIWEERTKEKRGGGKVWGLEFKVQGLGEYRKRRTEQRRPTRMHRDLDV